MLIRGNLTICPQMDARVRVVDEASLVVDLRNATGDKGTKSEKVFKL